METNWGQLKGQKRIKRSREGVQTDGGEGQKRGGFISLLCFTLGLQAFASPKDTLWRDFQKATASPHVPPYNYPFPDKVPACSRCFHRTPATSQLTGQTDTVPPNPDIRSLTNIQPQNPALLSLKDDNGRLSEFALPPVLGKKRKREGFFFFFFYSACSLISPRAQLELIRSLCWEYNVSGNP